MRITIVVLVLALAGCDQLSNALRSPKSATEPAPSEVTTDYLSCYSGEAHWSGMQVIFTRVRSVEGESWFADGKAVANQTLDANIVNGEATYTEYEKDSEYTVIDQPYRFRLDFVKGDIDFWFTTRYGEEAGEGKAWRFDGPCVVYQPQMSK